MRAVFLSVRLDPVRICPTMSDIFLRESDIVLLWDSVGRVNSLISLDLAVCPTVPRKNTPGRPCGKPFIPRVEAAFKRQIELCESSVIRPSPAAEAGCNDSTSLHQCLYLSEPIEIIFVHKKTLCLTQHRVSTKY